MNTTARVSFLGIATILLAASAAFFISAPLAHAAVTVSSAATGGSAISADTTGGAYTPLTGPTLTEDAAGDWSSALDITAPNGFEFDTSSTVTASVTTGDIVLGAISYASSTQISVSFSHTSTIASTVLFSGIKVRPTAGTPLATGNLTMKIFSGPTLTAGTLTEVAGATAGITVAPDTATIARGATQAYTASAQDAFGNSTGDVTSSTTFTINQAPADGGSFTGAVYTAVNSGIYTVHGVYGAFTDNTTSLTVTKADPTITFGAAPTPTYLGGNFTVSASTNNTDDSTLTYSVSSGPCALVSGSTFSSSGAGTCVVQASGAATANYNAATQTQNVTIAKATPTATLAVANSPLTYTAAAQAATVTISASSVSGTVSNVLYNGSATAPTNAGTYAVTATFTPTDSANYATLTGVSAGSFVISPANLAVTVTSVDNKGYDGTATATAHLSVAPLGSDVVSATYAAANFNNKNAGTGKSVSITGVSLTGAGAGNYIMSTPATLSGSADITQKNLTVSATADGKTYDGTPGATVHLSSADVVAGDTVTFADTSATFASANVGTAVPVTISGISLGGADSGNYNQLNATASASANITAKNLTISGAVGVDKQYDRTNAATVDFTGAALVGVVSGDDVTINPIASSATFADKTVAPNKAITVGGLTLTGAQAGNYTLTQPTGLTATISPVTLTLPAFSASDQTYDGGTTAHSVSLGALAGVITGDTVSAVGGTGTYTLAGKNAGSEAVTASGITLSGADAGNYVLTQPTTSLTVSPASLTISAVNNTKTYDGNVTAVATPSTSGLQGTDSVTGAAEVYTDPNAGTANKTLTVSSYTVNDGNGGNNYTVSTPNFTTGTINKANATIGVTPYSVTYDSATHTAAGSATGVVGESLSGLSVSGTAHTGAGDYPSDPWTFTDSTGNYNSTSGTVHDSIGQAALSVTANDNSKNFNNAAYSGGNGVVYSGFVGGETSVVLGGSLSYTGSSQGAVNAGSYAITPTGLSSGNYAITYHSGTLTVNPIDPTIVVTPYSVTYNGAAHTAAVTTATGSFGEDFSAAGNFTLTATTHTAAGDYASDAWSFTSPSGNYNSKSGTVHDAIAKASLTVTADNKSKLEGAVDPALTYTHGSLQGSDTNAVFSGALSRASGESVTTYAINQNTLSAGGNYSISYTAGTFTINPDPSASTFTVATSTSGSNVTGSIPTATATTSATDGGNLTLTIPAGTTVTGPSGWDGTVQFPTITTTPATEAPVAPAGSSVSSVLGSVEIGFPDTTLTFDKAVQLVFAGQAGHSVGSSHGFGTFHAITNVCTDNTQATNDLLPDGGDCKIDVGADLVVWTKHFSLFTTYTVNTPSSGGGTTSSGSGGGNGPIASGGGGGGFQPVTATTPTTPAQGQVLGAATYNFTTDFGVGATGADVTALQQILIAEGDLAIATPTGTFGPLTKAAVMKYQQVHGISPATGYVGPKTRAVLNAGVTPTMTDEQRSLQIQTLQQQLQTLMAKIKQLTGQQ
jgi:hypothetical protein